MMRTTSHWMSVETSPPPSDLLPGCRVLVTTRFPFEGKQHSSVHTALVRDDPDTGEFDKFVSDDEWESEMKSVTHWALLPTPAE